MKVNTWSLLKWVGKYGKQNSTYWLDGNDKTSNVEYELTMQHRLSRLNLLWKQSIWMCWLRPGIFTGYIWLHNHFTEFFSCFIYTSCKKMHGIQLKQQRNKPLSFIRHVSKIGHPNYVGLQENRGPHSTGSSFAMLNWPMLEYIPCSKFFWENPIKSRHAHVLKPRFPYLLNAAVLHSATC